MTATPSTPQGWAIALFERSVLKQAKLAQIVALLGPTEGRTCLDLGGDNGVVSALLRTRGGTWWSADLDGRTVAAIREQVGSNVVQIDGGALPFDRAQFDVVAIVDLLEHLHDDGRFVGELARVLKPGGRLVVNVPHIKRRSLLNRLRHAVGLTDAKHGHVRPGYTVDGLRALFGDAFRVEESCTYSKAFSETIDIALNLAYELRRGPSSGPASAKGTVVTAADLDKRRAEFRLLSAVYPVLAAWSRLDALLVAQSGYKLIVRATRREDGAQAPPDAGAPA
ncbi:MAG: class I SAM-dependent methyltransferase [Vicinamibacterales bacterium]